MKSFIHQSRSMYRLNVHKILLMCTAIESNHLHCILKAMSSYILNRCPRSRYLLQKSLRSFRILRSRIRYANSLPDNDNVLKTHMK